jgi:hypothetical protein
VPRLLLAHLTLLCSAYAPIQVVPQTDLGSAPLLLLFCCCTFLLLLQMFERLIIFCLQFMFPVMVTAVSTCE